MTEGEVYGIKRRIIDFDLDPGKDRDRYKLSKRINFKQLIMDALDAELEKQKEEHVNERN